ncbi:MAG: TonB-dependent receptor [Acidobacteriota bacterium]|nr:TonB-dependent receptor [Acidobacteriota bacterium]MDE3264100.1 TonB-dependent receptor [Acidobacteriota bacterium]
MTKPEVEPLRLSYLLVLFLALCLAAPVLAQEGDNQDESEAEEPQEFEETIVVVGTRTEGRTVTASPVPVDVIPETELVSQGNNDLTNRIRTVVPSYNVGTQPISDAATLIRPANLRGLAPDHTLVLVNGKRRHRAAVIAWLGNGISDGSQGPDISVIPAIALRQVEVLRDGASAQYGSDAIAGVLNFQLKDASSGGSVEIRTGQFQDSNPGSSSGFGGQYTFAGDKGNSYAVAANFGMPMGDNGFFNLSMEYGAADPTSRSVQRNDALSVIRGGNSMVRDPAQVWGSPLLEDDIKVFANFGTLFNNGAQFYGHANYATRTTTGGFYFRNPHTRSGVFSNDSGGSILVGDRLWASTGVAGAGGCPALSVVSAGDGGTAPDPAALAAIEADPNCFTLYSRFPGGFTPQFGGDLTDSSIVAGVRGYLDSGMTWDLSVNVGSSEVDQFIYNTVNASLGYDTPTSFNPGIYEQTDTNVNFDITYPVRENMSLAAGLEWRNEQFRIGAGDAASWEIGPYAAQGFGSGSNGFNGYRPENSGTWDRANVAIYGDLEIDSPDDRGTFTAALRVEDFDGFGNTINAKVSGRRQVSDAVSLRAAASTGFRAPTPGQQNAFNVTTAFDPETGGLSNSGTVPSTSLPAALRGGEDLQPEEAVNFSAGLVVDQGDFTLTADIFLIDVDDRLAVSETFRQCALIQEPNCVTDAEIEQLLSGGFVEARNLKNFRFFVNDFATQTQGLDVVGTWTPAGLGGDTSFSLVFNYTDTEVTDHNPDTVGPFRIATIEQGLPKFRYNLAMNHGAENWNLMARVNYFDGWWDSEDAQNLLGRNNAPIYPDYSGEFLLDVELGFPLPNNTSIALGVQNLLNTYPEDNPGAADGVGNRYGQFSPFGFNGAYYYVRFNYAWGQSF